MKRKTLIIGASVALVCAVALAALDATRLQNTVLIDAATSPERTATTLVAAQNFTTNATVQSAVLAKASYFGTAELVLGFSGNDDDAYKNIAQVVSGTNATLAGTTKVVAAYTNETDAISVASHQLAFTSIPGTHFAVKFTGVTDNAKAYRFGAQLISDGIPTAAQTATGSAVDKAPYTGAANIVVTFGSGEKGASTFTRTVQIQSADTSGGSYTDVSGMAATLTGASAGSATIPWDTTGGKRYIRAVYSTSNDVGKVTATINSFR